MNPYLVRVYEPFPIKVNRAEGIWIYDEKGRKFLDTFAGIGVLAFGHSDPEIKKAILEKMERHTHISNFFVDEDAEVVAGKLVNKIGAKGKVFFANSGTEANEAALKAVKKLKKGIIVSFWGNFHGRTIGSLSITGFERLRNPFLPLLDSITFLPRNDPLHFKKFMKERGGNVSAVFVEPILGSGGIFPLKNEMVEVIMDFKEKYDYILVVDEVQAGLGRTGRFFSHQHYNLIPDIVTVAKALGGGLPLGAAIFLEKVMDVFEPGDHGSTFAPNPLALAGARVVLDKLTDDFLKEVERKGKYFIDRLREIRGDKIRDIRGMGLMIGVELNCDGNEVKWKAFEKGLLLNVVKGKTIRFLPALNIKIEEIDEIVKRFEEVLKDGNIRKNS